MQTLTKTSDDAATAAMLGETPPSPQSARLKRLLDDRARLLREMDKVASQLVSYAKQEAKFRADIAEVLMTAGARMKDTRSAFLTGRDVIGRLHWALGVGNLVMTDQRDDKTEAPPSLAGLADHHEGILKCFEKGE